MGTLCTTDTLESEEFIAEHFRYSMFPHACLPMLYTSKLLKLNQRTIGHWRHMLLVGRDVVTCNSCHCVACCSELFSACRLIESNMCFPTKLEMLTYDWMDGLRRFL